MIKILFLSQGLPFPVYRDGVTVRVFHLLKEFSKYSNIHLIAFGDYPISADEKSELESLCTFDIIDLSQGKRQSTLNKIVSSRRLFDVRFEYSVKQAMSLFEPDVVFCEQSFIAQYGHLLGDTPKVMSAVDAISLAARRQAESARPGLQRLAWRYVAHQRERFETSYYPEFDVITAVSKEDADCLARQIKGEVRVVPNGVDFDFFAPVELPSDGGRVLFTGNLAPQMNNEAALYLLKNVFPVLKTRHAHLDLCIAGREPSTEVRAYCQSGVSLLPDLDDLREAYRGTIAYVSPVAYGTGIKNNVLQAMAAGLPVFVTPLIARPIGIEHGKTGFVAERGDEFVDLLSQQLSDRENLRKVGSAARELVMNRFSWPSVASTYLKIFDELLNGRC